MTEQQIRELPAGPEADLVFAAAIGLPVYEIVGNELPADTAFPCVTHSDAKARIILWTGSQAHEHWQPSRSHYISLGQAVKWGGAWMQSQDRSWVLLSTDGPNYALAFVRMVIQGAKNG